MDAKLNHSDFNALFSKHLNIPASKAELFTRAFFDILVEGLETDGIVKINGLGTFKMVDVASRGSVNVNTGEKIEIKGHRKLTFLPADTLKDKINQPFSMFEPVEVDDDYVDDEEEPAHDAVPEEQAVEQQVEEPAHDAAPEEQAVEQQVEEPIHDAVPEEQAVEQQVEEPSHDAAPEEQAVEQQVEEPAHDAAPEESVDEKRKQPEQTVESSKNNKGYMFAALSTLFIIIVAVVLYFLLGNKSKETEHDNNIASKLIENDSIKQAQSSDTIISQPVVVDEFVITESMNSLTLAQITIKDTTIYSIKGTMAVHRVGLDETLTKISLKYYEDKRFWPYIVNYNGIKNYNSLEIGTELLIPHLVPRK